ncbi:DUF4249 domain-containing protein [Dyadobacter sp. CY312]|uniref:DUF4249 domain-containing protein n=1 Tax=Dyadobacter sp. CY312 TaxID=2907303 RepID=UPI001F3FCA88|nr:DUF4249 domain-containing protein [Dyadobacter sp. CY312]MCE7041119.1 DUF4249 domain-containing protein [Dyadobacter sp. CY312]
MRDHLLKLSFIILVLVLNSCIEPFSPPEINSPDRYLVVDGFLNASNDTSWIELRHSQNTNDNATYSVESGARLTVESEGGSIYTFAEYGSGRYRLLPINISPADKYRLRIKRTNGQEYLSEYVKVSLTPPIDSINYRYDAGRDAMVIQVNTHDQTNKTQFYRWKFEETYQYRSAYISSLVYNPETKQIDYRNEDINLCWATKKSNTIILGSTIKLTSDIIKDLPINVVAVNTNKLYIKYSILVKQYGLSQEEFEYWTNLAKTTQGTGSLFDPQPSQVTGNIKNVADVKELVFGYFSVSKEEKKRIFMTPYLGQFPRCDPPDTVSVGDYMNSPAGYLMHYHGKNQDTLIRTSYGCADCRAQGGTTVKPSFWEF